MVRVSKAVALGVMMLLPMVGHTDDKDVVEYRQHIMKSLEQQTAALGQILSGVGPTENTVAHMQTLALTASIALKSFEPKVPGGAAKPEVWKDWAEFSKRMKDFADKSAEMAKIGREQGADQAALHVIEALPCKGCHDVYRDEKKI
jgi:cytochrome c556